MLMANSTRVPAETLFAPAAKATEWELARQERALALAPHLGDLLEGNVAAAAILNPQRQILVANQQLSAVTGHSRDDLIGERLGDAFGCVHAGEGPSGCGSAPACRFCGCAGALVEAGATGRPARGEWRILSSRKEGPEARDLLVAARPVSIGGETFLLAAIDEITDSKRREALERVFFHDVLNVAGALHGMLALWPVLSASERMEYAERSGGLAAQLVEEIESQRDLVEAERGDLQARPEDVDVARLLEQQRRAWSGSEIAEGKRLSVACAARCPSLRTDPVLLRRVLGNLVRNALEASGTGDTVTIAYEDTEGPRFEVHNEGVMDEAVQRQVFHRSFTTKGRGRGLGSFGAKLLAERYLGGSLGFLSLMGSGTTFILRLPR